MTGGLVTDCIFCRIVAGRAPADVVAQDDEFIAFRDARPMAPVHLLAVPRRHVASLHEIDQLDAAVAGRMLRFVAAVAGEAGMQQNGYRVISNIGRDAGQMVDHLHWHIVGGRRLGGHRMTEKACGMGSVEGRVIREEGAVEAHMKADTVVALKAGDKRMVGALRTVVAALKKERIDAGFTPSETDEFTILGRERKRRLETVDVYEQGGRKDLADQERYEAELIGGYLPTELSDEELVALIDEAVTAAGASATKEMGKVMSQLMPKVAGRADGHRVSDAVRARLSG